MFKFFEKIFGKIKAQLSQKGQGMVEYALIVAFVAGIAALALNTGLGDSIKAAFQGAQGQIEKATPPSSNSESGSESESEG